MMKPLFSKKARQTPRVISVTPAHNRLDFLKKRIVFRFLGFVAFVIVLCLFSIWVRVQVVGLGYDVNDLKQERETLMDDNKRLRIELALLKSPARLQKIFEQGTEMVLPDKDHIVKVFATPTKEEGSSSTP